MQIDGIRTVQPPAFFWFKTKVTLSSALTPEDARERLEKVLPRISVPPDRPGLSSRRGRVYTGLTRDSSFSLTGPAPLDAQRIPRLSVQGSIERSEHGSLVRLTIHPAASIGSLVLCWLCAIIGGGIWAILDRSLGAGPISVAAALGGMGVVLYPFGLIGVRTELAYLLDYLQTLFTP